MSAVHPVWDHDAFALESDDMYVYIYMWLQAENITAWLMFFYGYCKSCFKRESPGYCIFVLLDAIFVKLMGLQFVSFDQMPPSGG